MIRHSQGLINEERGCMILKHAYMVCLCCSTNTTLYRQYSVVIVRPLYSIAVRDNALAIKGTP